MVEEKTLESMRVTITLLMNLPLGLILFFNTI